MSPLGRPLDAMGRRTAQTLLDAILAADPARPVARVKRLALVKLRSVLVPWFDPTVVARIGPHEVQLPFSHNLPLDLRVYPRYSWNCAQLVEAIQAKYPDLTVIDVGANIGDTACMIRSVASARILCVEGDPRYVSFLEHNVANLSGIEIEPSFIGAQSGELQAAFSPHAGTGRIVRNSRSPGRIAVRSLFDIFATHPDFAGSKLLKIDTDGFEAEILFGVTEYLRRARPVLFVEYAPDLLNGQGPQIFPMLRDLGYSELVVYNHLGDYLLAAHLDDGRLIDDIHRHYSGWGVSRYADIAAFHAEDADLAAVVREGSLADSGPPRSGPTY